MKGLSIALACTFLLGTALSAAASKSSKDPFAGKKAKCEHSDSSLVLVTRFVGMKKEYVEETVIAGRKHSTKGKYEVKKNTLILQPYKDSESTEVDPDRKRELKFELNDRGFEYSLKLDSGSEQNYTCTWIS